jgi:hypothetical protein
MKEDQMQSIRAVLGVASIPLLSGCMGMGGWGHAGGSMGTVAPHHPAGGLTTVSVERAEASGDGLALALSFPTPTTGAVMTVSALLRWYDGDREPVNGEILLSIRTPAGSVDQLRMEKVQTVAAGAYEARYAFAESGRYVLTANAGWGTEVNARSVSVTTTADVGDDVYGHRHDRWVPAEVVGGIGMVALMVLMMGGLGH